MFDRLAGGRRLTHPYHPAMVHLPVGMWAGALVSDFLYFLGGNPLFAQISYYAIFIGIIGAAFAAITGLIDYFKIPAGAHAKALALVHMGLTVVATVLFLISYAMRGNVVGLGEIPVGAFALALLAMILLSVGAFLGGILAYTFRIGSGEPDFGESFERAKRDRDRAA